MQLTAATYNSSTEDLKKQTSILCIPTNLKRGRIPSFNTFTRKFSVIQLDSDSNFKCKAAWDLENRSLLLMSGDKKYDNLQTVNVSNGSIEVIRNNFDGYHRKKYDRMFVVGDKLHVLDHDEELGQYKVYDKSTGDFVDDKWYHLDDCEDFESADLGNQIAYSHYIPSRNSLLVYVVDNVRAMKMEMRNPIISTWKGSIYKFGEISLDEAARSEDHEIENWFGRAPSGAVSRPIVMDITDNQRYLIAVFSMKSDDAEVTSNLDYAFVYDLETKQRMRHPLKKNHRGSGVMTAVRNDKVVFGFVRNFVEKESSGMNMLPTAVMNLMSRFYGEEYIFMRLLDSKVFSIRMYSVKNIINSAVNWDDPHDNDEDDDGGDKEDAFDDMFFL